MAQQIDIYQKLGSKLVKPQRFSAEQVATALTRSKGLVSVAARDLNCTDATIKNYIKRYPTVQAAQQSARDGILDLAEARLFQAIDRGEPWAIMSTLRTIGKHRGYTERAEVDHTGSIGLYQVDIDDDDSSAT